MTDYLEYPGYKKIKTPNYILKIYYDESPPNPREEYVNLGTMIGFHRQYHAGDKHNYQTPEDFLAAVNLNECIALPVYLYDHGGVLYQTHPFSCRWDSGQTGVIYVTKEKARAEFGVKRISPQLKERIEGYLKTEVEIYSYYANGEVYGYTLKDRETKGKLESEHGFYGADWFTNGLAEDLPAEVQEALKNE